jgi:hypothetical protein
MDTDLNAQFLDTVTTTVTVDDAVAIIGAERLPPVPLRDFQSARANIAWDTNEADMVAMMVVRQIHQLTGGHALCTAVHPVRKSIDKYGHVYMDIRMIMFSADDHISRQLDVSAVRPFPNTVVIYKCNPAHVDYIQQDTFVPDSTISSIAFSDYE